jgi:proteasome accessory factor B
MSRRRSHRNALLVRLLGVIRDLSRRAGADIYELADRYQVAVRTIRRDLAGLQEAGLPLVEQDDGRRKRWRIAHEDARSATARIGDSTHAFAVHAALANAAPRSQTVHAALCDLAIALDAGASQRERSRLQRVESCFDAAEPAAVIPRGPDLLWPLVHAIIDRRRCDLVYKAPAASAAEHTVVPLKLFARNGALYMITHHERRKKLVTFAVHRIESFRVRDEASDEAAPADADELVASLFGVHGNGRITKYRLRFDAVVAPYLVERRWHPTQTIRTQADGSIELSFACQASFEVTGWVASWRHNVTVLAPRSLRAELCQLGRELARRYA